MAENVADTWEELDDSGELDKKLSKLVLQSSETTEKPASIVSGALPILQEECPGRTAYQPTVRILKRECNAAAANSSNHVMPRTKPTRTLQEREAAYAEARLRILGSAVSNDEETSSSEPQVVAAKISSDPAAVKDTSNILRQPHGPDGTKGFTVTR